MHWKRWIWATVKRSGLEINRAGPDVATFLRSRNVRTVFDVGANIGQYGRFIRAIGYRGEIVSFEPIGAVFGSLQETVRKDSAWTAHQVGLGAQDGQAQINISSNPVFSSILTTTPSAAKFDPAALPVATETITIHTLERYVKSCAAKPVFIKIDAQGFEQQVLSGCDLTDPAIVGIQLELPIINLYENTWSITDAIAFMRERGFVVSWLAPVNYHSQDRHALVEVDCIFRRSSELDG